MIYIRMQASHALCYYFGIVKSDLFTLVISYNLETIYSLQYLFYLLYMTYYVLLGRSRQHVY